MPKVYVLTTGEHDETTIIGVYSTQDNADLVKQQFSSIDNPDITEFELDFGSKELADNLRYFYICMLPDGTVLRIVEERLADRGRPPIKFEQGERWEFGNKFKWQRFFINIFAPNEMAAVVEANKLREQFITKKGLVF